MTIHEAEKEARESFRMLRHKSWPHFVPVQSIAGLEISVQLALSNEWEVEPVKRLISPKDLREAAVPVIRKYIAAGETRDELLRQLIENVFKGAK
jgi:hypothetical protein